MIKNRIGEFFLVSGFHRSGTSLLAQTLQSQGMHMGDELMGATFSNPLGHVEDMPVVRLHDKIYASSGCDWRYHDSSPLIKPIWFPNYIETYLQKRRENKHALVGVKDPRALHFLKDWKVAGQGTIRFIFIYRDWRLSCYSLLKRHSRHMLNSAHDIDKHKVNLSFWSQPDLAFKMWYSANSRMLSFYQQNQDQCLLFSQDALLEGRVAQNEKLESMGLSDTHFRVQGFEPALLSDAIPKNSLPITSNKEFEKLDGLLEELDQQADFASNSSNRAQEKPSNWLVDIPTGGSEHPITNIFEHATFDFSELTWAELSGAFVRIPIARYHYSHYIPILSRHPGASEEHLSVAKVAHMQGFWIVTRVLKIRAILQDCLLKGSPPFSLVAWSWGIEQDNWLSLPLSELANPHPFSLRDTGQLPDCMLSLAKIDLQRLSLQSAIAELNQEKDDVVEASLATILLSRELDLDALDQAYRIASERSLHHTAEYCLFLRLRFAYQTGDRALIEQSLCLLHKQLTEAGQSFWANHALTSDNTTDLTAKIEDQTFKQTSNKRHRFAVLPHMLSYQKILSIGYEDSLLGQQLDQLNSRLCFLARDNQTWLQNGIASLTKQAGTSLSLAIQNHWKKLWPEAINRYLYGRDTEIDGTLLETITHLTQRHSQKQAPNHAIVVHTVSVSGLSGLLATMDLVGFSGDAILAMTENEIASLKPAVKDLIASSSMFTLSVVASKFCHETHLNRYLEMEYDWIGVVSCPTVTNMQSRTRQLMRWYALFGFEFGLRDYLSVNLDLPSMLLTPYHPAELDDLQQKPLFYPDSQMFWLNKHAQKIALNITEQNTHRWLIKLIQAMKAKHANLAFMHELFLRFFEQD